MKRIAILGSSGSIGSNTLEVIKNFPKEFRVRALSVNSNIDILYRQIKDFKPKTVCVTDKKKALILKRRINKGARVLSGCEGIEQLCRDKDTDIVVIAISGSAALLPLLKAIENNKIIALANKEALVMAGPLICRKAMLHKVSIIPIDSEQSAIWQCLEGQDRDKLKTIYLTASGGPFKDLEINRFKMISPREALKHPRWKMGKKISVDSATLMNKGLEVLEAMYLFGVGPDKIKVIIHPQAIIHSMVEFVDGTVLAQLSVTNMRIPIQYALSYPKRLPTPIPGIDFLKFKTLNFDKPDFQRFPCLKLAYRAAYSAGTMPAVLNAANEVSVDEFLKSRLDYVSIPEVIERVMNRHIPESNPNLADIFDADGWARTEAQAVIRKLKPHN